MTELSVIFLVAFAVWAVGTLGSKLHTEHFDLEVLTPRNRRVLRWAGGLVMAVALFLILAKAVRDQFFNVAPPGGQSTNTTVETTRQDNRSQTAANVTAPAAEAPPSRVVAPPTQVPITVPPRRQPPPRPRPSPADEQPVETQQPTVQNNCVISGGNNFGDISQNCARDD